MITKLSIILLTLFLLGICGFVILLILMQRPSEESGMGATLGGGAVTSVFGGEAVNTLAKATKYCVVIFFLISFLLSLLYMSLEKTVKSQHLLEMKAVVTAEVPQVTSERVQESVISEKPTSESLVVPAAEAIDIHEGTKPESQPLEAAPQATEVADTLNESDVSKSKVDL
ncbi:MAG: preprotein translocase subunit SecG [Verrucomicrobiota bacterium]|nr:MAG: preprotein translocase subunit SecG [Verrucomicrobiota bacterium]